MFFEIRCYFWVPGVILMTCVWPFGDIFLTLWGLGGQVGSRFEQVEKRTYSILRGFLCFVAVYFSWFSWRFLGRPFSDFGGQSVSNESPLGPLFRTFCGTVGKVKPMVSFRPNHFFQGFEGLGLEILGNCFQLVFQTGSGGAILRFFVKCRVQPGPQRVTLGTISAVILRSFFQWFSDELRWAPVRSTIWQNGSQGDVFEAT